jgi:amino acid transporter
LIIGAIFLFTPKLSSTKWVFTGWYNGTGFDSSQLSGQIYVFIIGLLSAQFAFAGYDAAATMAEET